MFKMFSNFKQSLLRYFTNKNNKKIYETIKVQNVHYFLIICTLPSFLLYFTYIEFIL